MKTNQTQDFSFSREGHGEGGQKNNIINFAQTIINLLLILIFLCELNQASLLKKKSI